MSDLIRPVWIVFDKKFGAAAQSIFIKTSLNLRADMTLDGRGANISIVTKIDWNKLVYVSNPNPRYRGACGLGPARPDYNILRIEGASNIIVTHLKLTRDNYDGHWSQESTMDKECLQDLITVSTHHPGQGPTTNLWFNHLSLEHCGDGCMDFGYMHRTQRSYNFK